MTQGLREVAYRVWTAERDAALLKLSAQSLKHRAIFQILNRMDGWPIKSVDAIGARLMNLKARNKPAQAEIDSPGGPPADTAPRGAGTMDVSSLNSPPAREGLAVLFPPGVYTVVPYDFARKWAELHGLKGKYQGLDLKTVNAVRSRLKQPPFVLRGAL